MQLADPDTLEAGQLLSGQGRTRYIDNNLWRNLRDEDIHGLSDHEEEDDDQDFAGLNGTQLAADPLTGALMGAQQTLLSYHPTHSEAMILWKTHIQNVEPICKVLHIPSTGQMVETTSRQPATASKADECLLFAMYHFAVFSMTEEDCLTNFTQPRASLLRKYHFATRQALVNAAFLRTTEMSVLQALVLFLLPCRFHYDSHTYWILTGVAVRIAQRMGLHRDGEQLGLPPFDVQMRRRLFFQVIPLDGAASQMSGIGLSISKDSWDTKQPLNINDDQIWPGMTEAPKEQHGATEMIFCLTRCTLGSFFARAGKSLAFSGVWGGDYKELDPLISDIESEVEQSYLRYCDIVDPLHILTIGSARAAATAMRLRGRLPKVKNGTATDEERKELLALASKIMDTDIAAYTHTSLKKFMWHIKNFFAWGSWDSMVFILTSLRKSDQLSPQERDAAWGRVEQVYINHSEALGSKRALQIALGRLTLKAWNAHPPSTSVPTPDFITTLRDRLNGHQRRHVARQDSSTNTLDTPRDGFSPYTPPPVSDAAALSGTMSGDLGLEMGSDFNLDTVDWAFWDKLIQDYQTQGGQR